MTTLLTAGGAIGCAMAVVVMGRSRRRFEGTTLRFAQGWAIAAVCLWTATWGLTVSQALSPPLLDQLGYATALIGLCPAIAVLGARRPGVDVWSWFVVPSLLAVLGWPLLTVWGFDLTPRSLRLELPALVGFAVALFMGAGNYVGTRISIPVCLYALALCLMVAPISAVAPEWLQSSNSARHVAALLLGLSLVLADRIAQRSSALSTGDDRLWENFRDAFGIVWAKRVQDGINAVAAQQQWPARLEQDGFIWQDGVTDDQRTETNAAIDQQLRWHLRRFVDPAWIDQRSSPLNKRSTPG